MILGFAMAVVYVKQHFEKEEKGTIQAAVSTSGQVAEEPIVQPPEQIDRKAIPKNTEAELVSYEEQSYAPIEEAVEGLIHASELDVDPQAQPRDLLQPGQTVTAKIISLDKQRQRMGLRFGNAVMNS